MATILHSEKDAAKWFRKLLARNSHVFIAGSAGAGKSTLVKALAKAGIDAVDGDRYGSMKDGKWVIDFSKFPKSTLVACGNSDNLDALVSLWPDAALVVLRPSPERWINTMAKRAKYEKHNWTDKFKEYSGFTPDQASAWLAGDIIRIRETLSNYGDRTFAARTADWSTVKEDKGRG